jgi:lipopolysaccharide biosynthesis glycosyltransferase
VNLIKWREADVTPRLVAYAKENFDIVRYWDQDTLNAVFRGQVLFLPPRWNFQARNADLPAWVLGLNQEEFALLRKNPSIVHYTTHVKPWLYQQEPHYKQLYYKYLALTPWRDFKPANRTVRTALTKFVRMEKLKQLIKWRLPELFRSVRQWTGRGSPFLRKLQGQLPR